MTGLNQEGACKEETTMGPKHSPVELQQEQKTGLTLCHHGCSSQEQQAGGLHGVCWSQLEAAGVWMLYPADWVWQRYTITSLHHHNITTGLLTQEQQPAVIREDLVVMEDHVSCLFKEPPVCSVHSEQQLQEHNHHHHLLWDFNNPQDITLPTLSYYQLNKCKTELQTHVRWLCSHVEMFLTLKVLLKSAQRLSLLGNNPLTL